jgi:hypothetical protein
VRLERLDTFKKRIYLIRSGTRDIQTCSIVRQLTTLPRANPDNSIIITLLIYFVVDLTRIYEKLSNRSESPFRI